VSLYRQTGRTTLRTVAAVAVAALVVGLAIGYLAGRSGTSDPSLASQLSALRDRLAPAREGLELAPGEYAQGVRGGRVVSAAEYGGARAAVTRAAKVVAANRDDLRALGATRAAAVEDAIAALSTTMEQRADPAQVKRLAAAAGTALRAAVAP
jgi:hypothetical protein